MTPTDFKGRMIRVNEAQAKQDGGGGGGGSRGGFGRWVQQLTLLTCLGDYSYPSPCIVFDDLPLQRQSGFVHLCLEAAGQSWSVISLEGHNLIVF